MRQISYTNTSGNALDCRVLRLAGTSDTSGTVIKEYLDVADDESFIYTPSLSGLYTVATKAEGVETDYVIDEDFVPVYITAIRNNSAFPIISGYSLKEFSDYFKLKLHLTDNMNSDVQFQNFAFEILYSYVDGEGDDYNAAVPEFTSAESPIIHGAKEHSIGGRYFYPVMMIRESDEYTTEHNIKAASDFYSYQHKAMFIGDTIMIPKINGQAEVGRYLIFSIRRRPLNRSITETSVISQCFSAPVTIETSYNKIAALQTGVDASITLGAPVTPVASSVKLPIGTGITLDFTAKTKGVIGDSITIALIDPEADGNIGVAVTGKDIVVTLGYGTGAITSTLADVKTAIEDDEKADALVSVAITGENTTLAIAVAETSLDNGVDGTVGAAGALRYSDTELYVSINESTTAVSNWLSAPLLPTLPTVIELSNAAAYVIGGGKNSIVVVTDGAEKNWIILPAATVGLRVTIINQDSVESANIYPANGEYINGSDSTHSFKLATPNSATFYCYADGYWAII